MRSAAIFAALALAGASAAVVAAPARNWITTVAPAPGGTYVFGNPAAKAKLVEYLSYTCSHCGDFAVQSWPVLKRDYLAKGTTSVEIRHAVRDPMDMAAALLARCEGAGRFLGHSEAIFATQRDWMAKGVAFASANGERLKTLPVSQSLGEFAQASGLTQLMRTRGMPQAKINACLSSKAQQDQLAAIANEAWRVRRIPGTPAFLLNGTLVSETASWDMLKPKLDAAAN
jgi:protein-disulfide isomerase